MNAPHLLVIQHEDSAPPEWFGDWWQESGARLDVVMAHAGAPIPEGLGDHDALVVLGGDMGANDDAAYRWLTPTKALIRTVVSRGQPFLGICLGHQLAAVALGGEVQINGNGHSTGLTPVALTDEGRDDPLLCSTPTGAQAIQWNGDVVTRLPEGAVRLADAPDGTVQAARLAPRAWSLQFHPETSPALFRRWTVDKDSAQIPREDGIDVAAVSSAIDDAEDELRRTWRPLALRFSQLVAAAACPGLVG